MLKEKENIITNFWFSIIASLIVGALLVLLIQQFWLPALAFGFAITREIISYYKSKYLESKKSLAKLTVLQRFATDKIDQTRAVIKRKNVTSLIYCFVALEFISTEIANCCDDANKANFKKVKGLISDTKTTFDRSRIDTKIEKPYNDAVTAIANLETYLNDL